MSNVPACKPLTSNPETILCLQPPTTPSCLKSTATASPVLPKRWAWRCAAPHGDSLIDFGRVLWGEAHEYPQEILLREGAKPAGLFHLRIT